MNERELKARQVLNAAESTAEQLQTPEQLNQAVVEEFIKKTLNNQDAQNLLEKHNVGPENYREFMNLFVQLHDCVNNPKTREKQAFNKALMVKNIAQKFLTENKNLKESDYLLELIKAKDPISGTTTYNVLITIGDFENDGVIKNGPATVYMVHHDVIDADSYNLTLTKDETIMGSTIQDNTIHLAALLYSLKTIKIPESGAIIFVATDHEELGCRGSSAISGGPIGTTDKYKLERVTDEKDVCKEVPSLMRRLEHVANCLIAANESTKGDVAIGHKGKCSAELKTKEKPKNIDDLALTILEKLAKIQLEIRKKSQEKKSLLGTTDGIATYAAINEKLCHVQLDWRTSDTAGPEKVEQAWRKSLSNKLNSDLKWLILRAKENFHTEEYSFTINNKELIIIRNLEDAPSHPSAFNPEEDTSILPALTLVIAALKEQNLASQIKSIEWGNAGRLNSVPMQCRIALNQNIKFNPSDLRRWMTAVDKNIIIPAEDCLELTQVANTQEVSPTAKTNPVIVNGLRLLHTSYDKNSKIIVLRFMTDVARLFNYLTGTGKKCIGIVFGVGKIANLHKSTEELTPADCITIMAVMPELLQIMHQSMIYN